MLHSGCEVRRKDAGVIFRILLLNTGSIRSRATTAISLQTLIAAWSTTDQQGVEKTAPLTGATTPVSPPQPADQDRSTTQDRAAFVRFCQIHEPLIHVARRAGRLLWDVKAEGIAMHVADGPP